MLVAFCDQLLGNSTPVCSKAMRSPCPMRAVRDSHSTASKGGGPGSGKKRSIESAVPGSTGSTGVGCGLDLICGLAPSLSPRRRRADAHSTLFAWAEHRPARAGRKNERTNSILGVCGVAQKGFFGEFADSAGMA